MGGRAGPAPGGAPAAEQQVGLLDDGQVAQPGRAGRPGPMRHPKLLGQSDEHGTQAERLVAVVAHILHLKHGVGLQQPAEVESVAALDEPADRAEPEPGQPDPDEAEHVIGTALAVAGLPDDLLRGPLQIGEGRIPGVRVGHHGLAQRQIPSRLLVRSPQRGAKHLRNGSADRTTR